MVEFVSGVPLFVQQYKALLKKNFILTKRNMRTTIIQIFSPLLFLSMMFFMQRYLVDSIAKDVNFENIVDPQGVRMPEIPRCEHLYVLKKPCLDFVWSGNGSPRIENIVKGIMRNNPGRPITDDKVMSFKTPEEVDEWLFNNPMRCPGALHFVERNSTVISYGIQNNSTLTSKKERLKDPVMQYQVPLQLAAEREITRSFLGVPDFSWTVQLKEFAHLGEALRSPFSMFATTFFLAMAMFSFVFQIGSLVLEKELKLRQAMSMMGLYESAYWLSWVTWEGVMTFISSFFTILFGLCFRFDFFRLNSFAVVFLVFFFFGLSMVGFAFALSTLISKSSSATTVGFLVYIMGFIAQMVNIVKTPQTRIWRTLWFLFPPNYLVKALVLLNGATSTPESLGISWSKRKQCPSDNDCDMTIDQILQGFISTFLVWFVLAIYLDHIIPNSNGMRKSVFFFLSLSYWKGEGGNKVEEGSVFSFMGSLPTLEEVEPDDEDVLAEETKVRNQARQNEIDADTAVQIRGLKKTYPGTWTIRDFKIKGTKPYHAVKGIWVNLARNQLFCLLGPNGAGKTTVISCLTGVTAVTGGDAIIYGNSIRNPIGAANIRRIIGVCPQFDILWDSLTGLEHMYLFSCIKGLPPLIIESEAAKSLAEVRLSTSAHVRAGSYSGGMKRRLSVAIALIGDPKMVFLDEPTTGMDPITRRQVWNIIEHAKKGRAIVLTTHSMEEADVLSDRIGIMAKGTLRCIGNSLRLKSRFGTGYAATVSFSPNISEAQAEAVKQFFKHHLNVLPKEEDAKFMTFIIPHDREPLLTKFFSELQEREKELDISDMQLSLTTLEEVFLNIAKQAEADEGILVPLALYSGSMIQIPKGARFVGIPGTESLENPKGLMVEVFWHQDDAGGIYIYGHSEQTPIPPHVKIPAKSLNSVNSRDSALPVGFAINPKQIVNRQ